MRSISNSRRRADPSVRNLREVNSFAMFYLSESEKLLRSKDIESLLIFRTEVSAFVGRVQHAWFGKRFRLLRPSNRARLASLMRDLQDLEISLAVRTHDMARDSRLLREMEDLAFPEPLPQASSREYSSWAQSPLKFSRRLLAAIVGTSTPG